MKYVYQDGSPVPPEAVAGIVFVPPGFSERFPLGAFVTPQGVVVTKLNETFGLSAPQDPSKYMVVDLTPELRDLLARIALKVGA